MQLITFKRCVWDQRHLRQCQSSWLLLTGFVTLMSVSDSPAKNKTPKDLKIKIKRTVQRDAEGEIEV